MTRKLRVLFYEDPVTDYSSLLYREPHIRLDAPWLKSLLLVGCDARMLVNNRLVLSARECGIPDSSLMVVDEDKIISRLYDPLLDVNSLFHRNYGELVKNVDYIDNHVRNPKVEEISLASDVVDVLTKMTNSVLLEFEPDVIFTWVPVPHLRIKFPDALILHKETGIFSRPPYPLTYYLDPLGFHKWSTIAAGCPTLASAEAKQELPVLKEFFEQALELVHGPSSLQDQLRKFTCSTLVATQTNGVFLFDAACRYRSQAHLILDVLENVPRDHAVIASQHPDCLLLSSLEIKYLTQKYPNFIYIPPKLSAFPITQDLLRSVDLLATVSSSLGLQAVLWNKPLAALGESHLNRFSHVSKSVDINEKVKKSVDSSSQAAWLIFHYCYNDKWIQSKGWLASHLEERVEHWRLKGELGYFEHPWAAPQDIVRYELDESLKFFQTISAGAITRGSHHRVEMDALNVFKSGWGVAETGGNVVYRWITGHAAELLLQLSIDTDWIIIFQAATVLDLEGQSVQIGIGDVTLSRNQIPTNGVVKAEAKIPSSLIQLPATRIWIKAEKAVQALPDPRHLSLIISEIGVFPEASIVSNYNSPNIGGRHPAKQSIIIPVLNGGELLKITLPKMLSSAPDGIEFVISDNQSDDDTWPFLQSIKDSRLIRIRTDERIDYARNADFAYRHANGIWLSHLGDDDLPLVSRFQCIEAIAKARPDTSAMFCGRVRYYWPDFPDKKLANSVDKACFGNTVLFVDGPEAGRKMINSSNIRHTGATVLRSDLVDRIRSQNDGILMPQRLGEYAAFRIAAGLSKEVSFINQPVVIIGRHAKSIGTGLFHGQRHNIDYGRNLEREIGSSHGEVGFNYLGFQPFSMEGAIYAAKVLEPLIGACPLDYPVWRDRMLNEIRELAKNGSMSVNLLNELCEQGVEALANSINMQEGQTYKFGTPLAVEKTGFGWQERKLGFEIEIHNIVELADWIERKYSDQLSPERLMFQELSQADVVWVDS